MKTDFDFLSSFSGTWQLLIGALLATVGGFVATQIEWFVERRRRQRNAALFLGELLSTLRGVIQLAAETKKIGEPFGPVTLRILRGAQREIDLYERNRENLLDLQDATLRARIHTLVLRISMPLESIFDSSQELDALKLDIHTRTLADSDRHEIERRMEAIRGRRDGSYDYMMQNVEQIRPMVTDLEPLARHSFSAFHTAEQT
ncbi:MAG TPA: hypothetical protein VGF97_16540 [Rhizomicrobium sp.]|jgi:hypothetical protein